jgi:hypothetical protein
MTMTPKFPAIPKDVSVGKAFHGTHPDGQTALVRRSAEHDYAQFDDIRHVHAYGWHKYPLNTFKPDPVAPEPDPPFARGYNQAGYVP